MTTDTLLPPACASRAIDDKALDQLFRAARSHNGWLERPVPEALLRQAVDLAKMGPTSVNTLPMRVVFVKSAQAKARLKPALAPGNIEKTMTAPVTAIVGYDLGFPDLLPKLFPHVNARAWFAGNEALIVDTARRNGSLQGAYFILALRAIGLDVGPISGFDPAKVDAARPLATTIAPTTGRVLILVWSMLTIKSCCVQQVYPNQRLHQRFVDQPR